MALHRERPTVALMAVGAAVVRWDGLVPAAGMAVQEVRQFKAAAQTAAMPAAAVVAEQVAMAAMAANAQVVPTSHFRVAAVVVVAAILARMRQRQPMRQQQA